MSESLLITLYMTEYSLRSYSAYNHPFSASCNKKRQKWKMVKTICKMVKPTSVKE